ncbi:D-alanyl-lipoteichoic acid biosynthesis protein DltD [Sporolactobacillus pectinivorans]|uniref:D-alanyl-lipoteichoic acid biosynthesis protein DltD n=1 Tax=Sporolactobacillus pectinivorans TaxID=1591408 RepID=UPI000C263907|nr:D-alanyl-lipoteichoic acid biosynthesis protein DltD [Sporolactobacillus pectinivorans]
MRQPRFGPMILASVIAAFIVFMPSSLEEAMISKNDVSKAASSLDPHIFQGILMQQKMIDSQRYLPIYGSSELHRLDKYHPTNYFKIAPDGFTPFLIGRGGMYSLVHFLNLASTADSLRNRKIVFILSPEWFNSTGLDTLHFSPNFSKEQVYHFIFTNNMDRSLKEKAARRLLQFSFIRNDGTIAPLLNGIAFSGHSSLLTQFGNSIRGWISYKILTLHDLIQMYQITPNYYQSQYQNPDPQLRGKSWEQLLQSARRETQTMTNSNPFHIDNTLYAQSIKGRLARYKNYYANQNYSQSPEYGDLQLVLDLLKEKHIRALFISVPFNGAWYDYTGVSLKTREVCYEKIAHEVRSNGFQLADFTRFDSEPYFLQDTMHIGPEGWVYIDQAIENFYNEKT